MFVHSQGSPILIVPGWGGSGPDHWQSIWQRQLDAARTRMTDWFDPRCAAWVDAIEDVIDDDSIVVAHSLGCIATVHWAQRLHRPLRAALFVAPADVEIQAKFFDFAPILDEPLPFPSALIASSDDPYMTLARSRHFARQWHSELHVISNGGHLNAESDLGEWSHARDVLDSLLESLDGDRSARRGPQAVSR